MGAVLGSKVDPKSLGRLTLGGVDFDLVIELSNYQHKHWKTARMIEQNLPQQMINVWGEDNFFTRSINADIVTEGELVNIVLESARKNCQSGC